jgi:hypothetical protein
VVGFNHNVKYGERVYHVQTEDSGLPHAHYITHLFVGGNIIASMKTSYAEKMEQPDLAKVVRGLMETQHKQMLKRLVAGEFRDLASKLVAQHYEPGVLADGTNTASYVNTDPDLKPVAKPAPVPARPMAPPAARPPQRAVTPPPPAQQRPAAAPQRMAPPVMTPQRKTPAPAPQRMTPPPPAPRPAAAPPRIATPPPPRAPGEPLPAVTRGPVAPARPAAPPRMAPFPSARPAVQVAAVTKPSVFSDGPVEMPHDDLPTLFAEELISEKSLDEVILAFLSADIEPPK